jgi:hypothetical protein
MEQELKLIPRPPPGQLTTVIRLVSDLQMWVKFPLLPTGESGRQPGANEVRYPIAVVQMPVPEFMTHAYYVGIVLAQEQPGAAEPTWPEARVFTLEKIEEQPTDGRLCEWIIGGTEMSHRNYGTQVPVTREEFIKAVFAKTDEPGQGRYTSTTFHLGAARPAVHEHKTTQALNGIRCPKCAWVPLKSTRWSCTCQHIWNTFDTRGKCPNCSHQWTETACPACKQMSSHDAWYAGAN